MKGQVALIVLIVSAVVLTFGLSISKKTVVETKIDTDEELLKKAFNAAESGIDYYLGSGKVTYVNDSNQERADVTVKQLGVARELSLKNYTLKNQRVSFWLVNHNDDGSVGSSYYSGTISLCVEGFTGKLKVDYFYRDGTTDAYKVARYGYNIGGGDDSGFIGQSLTSGCFSFALDAGNKSLIVAVVPLSGGAQLSMKGSVDFPSQGQEITSVGRAGDTTSGTGVNKQVTVVRGYEIPFFMMDAVTSGSRVLSK